MPLVGHGFSPVAGAQTKDDYFGDDGDEIGEFLSVSERNQRLSKEDKEKIIDLYLKMRRELIDETNPDEPKTTGDVHLIARVTRQIFNLHDEKNASPLFQKARQVVKRAVDKYLLNK